MFSPDFIISIIIQGPAGHPALVGTRDAPDTVTVLILPKVFKEVIHFRSYVNVLNLRLYYKNVVVILVPVDAQQLCTSTGPRVNLVPRSTSRYRRQT
eukprot:SAG31_NODE_1313_length_8853_cov_60.435458_2_plen_97_part_00